MIVLFEENETKFTSLGLGVLSDPISCLVTEGLNDNFELQLVYPVIGANYSKIKINRLLFTKPNPYEEPQPFRIISITKPINGKVTVDAVHISYDTNGIIVKPVKAGNLSDAVEKIQNGAILDHEFKIYTDMTGTKTFATTNYYNLRALLMGSDSSLMNVYNCELSFDKFKIYLNKQRGTYRGAQVRYAKNMKDLSHVISYEKLYNGVYPFYHQETTETTTNTTSDGFKKVYIVGTKPFQDGWLSYTDGGEPYHPIDESPVQIGSNGDYKDKVYCWNTNLQRYQQKKYNEMFTVMEGVLSPEWIYIDWNSLLTTGKITCKAKVDGYFKMMTEEDWTFHKADEIIFQGSFKNIAEQLIIYYSEVIPGESTSEVTETESVTHVELDDQIIWLDTDGAKDMKHNRILSLDLTSEFEDVPDKDALELKAKEYIEKNKIGKYKYETRVSFVDLSKTKEGVQYEGFEKILLGDIVKVVYEDMGVDVELRVTSVKYDVLKDAYDSVDLGEKPEKMSSSSVQNGDDISALTNDVGYADITTVNKLVAKIVTADFIKAKDAELSKAQIEMLETARIKCTGIIEASQFELDTLIAKLLIADNAQIKDTLEAGTVKVNGDITISKGSINIKDDEKGTVFNVDREGNVRANSVSITGGILNINNGVFEVERDGTMHATGAIISGQIDAQSGSIAGFNIVEDALYNGINSMKDSGRNGVYISPDGIRLVGSSGEFKVDSLGKVTATAAELKGEITATSGYIGSLKITSNGLEYHDSNAVKAKLTSSELSYGIKASYKGTYSEESTYTIRDVVLYELSYYECISNIETPEEFNIDHWVNTSLYNFKVDSNGTLRANNANILSGSKIGDFEITKGSGSTKAGLYYKNGGEIVASITPDALTYGSKFSVDSLGNVKLSNAEVTGLNSNKALNIKHVTIEDDSYYKGDYSSSKTYNIDDIVSYELTYYKCIIDVSNPEEFDSSKWGYVDSSIYDRAYIAYNKTDFSSNSSGIYLGTNGLKLGSAFRVDIDGNLIANNVTVSGTIKAEASRNAYLGGPSGFVIGVHAIYNTLESMTDASHNGIYLGTDGIRLKGGSGEFKVDSAGKLTATDVNITGSGANTSIAIANGKLTAVGVDVLGEIKATTGQIGSGDSKFNIDSNSISNGTPGLAGSVFVSTGTTEPYTIANKYQSGWKFGAGPNFGVDANGIIYATNIKSISGDQETTYNVNGINVNLTTTQTYWPEFNISVKKNNNLLGGIHWDSLGSKYTIMYQGSEVGLYLNHGGTVQLKEYYGTGGVMRSLMTYAGTALAGSLKIGYKEIDVGTSGVMDWHKSNCDYAVYNINTGLSEIYSAVVSYVDYKSNHDNETDYNINHEDRAALTFINEQASVSSGNMTTTNKKGTIAVVWNRYPSRKSYRRVTVIYIGY